MKLSTSAASLMLLSTLCGCSQGTPTAREQRPETPLRIQGERDLEAAYELQSEQITRLLKRMAQFEGGRPVLCMQRLLGLPPEWKERLNLHLLDFSGEGVTGVDAMARADIEDGHYNILTGGLNAWQGQPTRTLRDKHGIIVMDIATCTDGRAIFDLITAYNAVSIPAVEQEFGAKVIEEALGGK